MVRGGPKSAVSSPELPSEELSRWWLLSCDDSASLASICHRQSGYEPPTLSHIMYLLISLRKSTAQRNHPFIVYYYTNQSHRALPYQAASANNCHPSTHHPTHMPTHRARPPDHSSPTNIHRVAADPGDRTMGHASAWACWSPDASTVVHHHKKTLYDPELSKRYAIYRADSEYSSARVWSAGVPRS